MANRSGVLRDINSETLRLKRAKEQTRRRSLDFVLTEPTDVITYSNNKTFCDDSVPATKQ